MCHSYLKVDLGEDINFITGPNGSGKSAILTALTVALGGRAKFTNRGGSIAKLLKSGEDAGQIIVRLRNHGSDAFQPDKYGSLIVVERNITKDGPAPYKLKSEKGLIN
jgi:chromosome segregation ATPase